MNTVSDITGEVTLACDQAHVTATNIWQGINDALEKFCPEKGPCFKESMRDKIADTLRVVFAHITSQTLQRTIQILTRSEDNRVLELTDEEIALRGRVAEAMCRALFDLANPDEVNERLDELERLKPRPRRDRFAFLEEVFWPETLEPMKGYYRYEDDSPTGSIGVVFGNDGDGHITVFSNPDPNELRLAMRFRMPMTGGGQSPRVRNALLALAEAIRRDNEDHPQSR